jgi:hypothetical protein
VDLNKWDTDGDCASATAEASTTYHWVESQCETLLDNTLHHFISLPFVCNTVVAHSVAAVELSMGMLDTGANLSISNPHLAIMLGASPRKWP